MATNQTSTDKPKVKRASDFEAERELQVDTSSDAQRMGFKGEEQERYQANLQEATRASGAVSLPPGGVVPVAATNMPVIVNPIPQVSADIVGSLMSITAGKNPNAPGVLRQEGAAVEQMLAVALPSVPTVTAFVNGQPISIPGDIIAVPVNLHRRAPGECREYWMGLLGRKAKKMAMWASKKGHYSNPSAWLPQIMYPLLEGEQWRPKHSHDSFNPAEKNPQSGTYFMAIRLWGPNIANRLVIASELGNVPILECIAQISDEIDARLKDELKSITERQAITNWYEPEDAGQEQ